MTSKNRAVFLDRDGVLIEDVDYLSNLDDIVLYEDVTDGLRSLKANGYILLMITNQSGVARGFFTESFVQETYNHLNRMFEKAGVILDGLYYCPHHPLGFPPFNITCNCRKPAPGMIRRAATDHDIDCQRSFMVGDKQCDIELAFNAGTRGILLKTGKGILEAEAVTRNHPGVPIFDTFSEATDYILESNL